LIEALVIAITLISLIAFLLPQMVREKRRTVCKKNLGTIAIAFKTWALDARDRYSTETPVAEGGTLELINSGQVFVHFKALFTNLNLDPKVLVCPADSKKKYAKDFLRGLSDENVSYFIGADADENFPGAILAGDRNLAVGGVALRPGLTVTTTNSALSWTRAIHRSCGNILLSDGSVQFFDSAQLKMAVQSQGIGTNRLLIP
jgi:hypothetical protein